METEVLSGLLGVAVTIIVALLGLLGVLLRRSNGGRRRPVNPGDPDDTPLGDVSVRWWKEQMDDYTGQIVDAIKGTQ